MFPILPNKRYKFKIIEDSQKEIPNWLSKTIASHPRIWGVTIFNYPLKFIRPSYESNNNPRINPQSRTDLLTDKIQRFGLIGTLPVVPCYRDQKTGMTVFELISGDCRWLALQKLNYTVTNIEIYEGSEKEIAPLRMALNLDSELHPADQADYIFNILIQKFKYSHEQISTMCSVNRNNYGRSWVTSMAGIAQNCCKDVMNAWREDKIKKAHTLLFAHTFVRDEAIKQKRLLDKVLKENMSGLELKKFIENPNEIVTESKLFNEFAIIQETEPEKKKNIKSFLQPKKIKTKNPHHNRYKRTYYQISKRRDLLKLTRNNCTKEEVPILDAIIREYSWLLLETEKMWMPKIEEGHRGFLKKKK